MRQLSGILGAVAVIAAFSSAVPSIAADSRPLPDPAIVPMAGSSATSLSTPVPVPEAKPIEPAPIRMTGEGGAFRHHDRLAEGAGWFGGFHLYGNVYRAIDVQPRSDMNKAMKKSGLAADFGRDSRYPEMSGDGKLTGGMFEVAFDLVRWLRISGRYHWCPNYDGTGFVDRRLAAGGGYEYITMRETLETRRSGCGVDLVLKKKKMFSTVLGLGVDEWRTSVSQSATDATGRVSNYRENGRRRLGGVVRVASELTPAGWLSFRIAVMKSFVEPVQVQDYAVVDYGGNSRVLTAHDLDLSEIAVTFGFGIHL